MNVKSLSKSYYVRKLSSSDVDVIYHMCCKNALFYQYHPPFVTKESILEDMKALPLKKNYEDKYYIGFFEENSLVAIMDLIVSYPTDEISYIGLFMTNIQYQNKGIGSKIIKEVISYLKLLGYKRIRLGVDKGNLQSYSFWLKNKFHVISEDNYICMELSL